MGTQRGPIELRQYRNRAALTQAQLGERVGDKAGDQLRKFESGERPLPIPLAIRIAQETGLPLESLLTPERLAVVTEACELIGDQE